MNCPNCHKANLVRRRTRIPGRVKGESVEVVMTGLVCPRCGYVTVDGKDMAEYMGRVADAYRSRHGLLTGEQIRDRRKSLGMSQAKFAEHLGVGLASIKRWETGRIQDRSSDRLIRLDILRQPAPDVSKRPPRVGRRKLLRTYGVQGDDEMQAISSRIAFQGFWRYVTAPGVSKRWKCKSPLRY